MTLIVESPKVYTTLGVAISVTGIAQVSLGISFKINSIYWYLQFKLLGYYSLYAGEDPGTKWGNVNDGLPTISWEKRWADKKNCPGNSGRTSKSNYGNNECRGNLPVHQLE